MICFLLKINISLASYRKVLQNERKSGQVHPRWKMLCLYTVELQFSVVRISTTGAVVNKIFAQRWGRLFKNCQKCRVPQQPPPPQKLCPALALLQQYLLKNLKDILTNIICSINNNCLSMRVAHNPHVYYRDRPNVTSPLSPKTYP